MLPCFRLKKKKMSETGASVFQTNEDIHRSRIDPVHFINYFVAFHLPFSNYHHSFHSKSFSFALNGGWGGSNLVTKC